MRRHQLYWNCCALDPLRASIAPSIVLAAPNRSCGRIVVHVAVPQIASLWAHRFVFGLDLGELVISELQLAALSRSSPATTPQSPTFYLSPAPFASCRFVNNINTITAVLRLAIECARKG
jgi:hypothetical protein